MCLVVFIASDMELPLIPWDNANPGFYVAELPKYENKVQNQFSLPHVRYAGSHLGCGCGFFKVGDDPEEREEAQENYKSLAEYIEAMIQRGATCEIFSCWEGDQGELQDHQITLTTRDLVASQFEFKEKAFYEFA